MKALTLTEPWATLVMLGEKRVETRSWACDYRGPLAIHSAKRCPKKEFAALVSQERFYRALRLNGQYAYPELNRGHVLCITNVLRCVRTEEAVKELSEKEIEFGNYGPGRWAFFLGPVERIKPVPATGHLMLWDWNRPPEGMLP